MYNYLAVLLVLSLTACQPVSVAPLAQTQKNAVGSESVKAEVAINESVKTPVVGNAEGFKDPCTLVSQSELEGLVGAPLKKKTDATTKGASWQTFCVYEGVDEGELFLAQLSVINPALLPSAVTVKKMFDEMKTYVSNPKDVANVGTAAYHSTGLSGGLVVFDQGINSVISLTIGKGVGYQASEADIAKEAELAQKIIDRLAKK